MRITQTTNIAVRLIDACIVFALLGGCTSSKKHRDAQFHSYPQLIGPSGDRHYSVRFPALSLADTKTTTFSVHGLPPALYQYNLVVPLPKDIAELGAAPPTWGSVEVAIRFARPDGSVVAEKTYDLGRSIEGQQRPDDGRWQMSLAELKGIDELRDYDVTISVLRASANRKDTARLEAWANVNLRDGIDGAKKAEK